MKFGNNNKIVLIHGVATSNTVWDETKQSLESFGYEVICPQRLKSGSIDQEVDHLWNFCENATVIGVSGGATLVVELASRNCPWNAGIAHETAVGSLVPGLLNHVVKGLNEGGVEGFGRSLYEDKWDLVDKPYDSIEVVKSELQMFKTWEPQPVSKPLIITVGEKSPKIRLDSVKKISEYLDVPYAVIHYSHAAHLNNVFANPQLIENLTLKAKSHFNSL